MIRRLLALLLLVLALPLPAAAQPTLASTFLEGSWGLRYDGTTVMRFDLELTEDGWTGGWVKPGSFNSDGQRFGNIKMPPVERRADTGRAIGDWAEITFNDPRAGEEPDQFRIRLIAADRAEMIYVGTGLPPFTLERVGTGASLGPFEEGKIYGPSAPRTAAVPPAQRPSQRPPAAQPTEPAPPPAEEEPVQGPPAMIGR